MLALLLFLALPLGAREIYPLNEGWRFFYASEPNSDNARFVTLPHSWNNNPTAEGSLRETTGLYQNDLRIRPNGPRNGSSSASTARRT